MSPTTEVSPQEAPSTWVNEKVATPPRPTPRAIEQFANAFNTMIVPTRTSFERSRKDHVRSPALAGREADPKVDVDVELARTIARRSKPPRDRQFVRKKEWVGRVEEVGSETFFVSLTDVTRPAREAAVEESAEIYLDEIAPKDHQHLRPGAIFYWVIGYVDEPHGQRVSRSQFLFRRPRQLSDDEKAVADRRAEQRWEALRSREQSES